MADIEHCLAQIAKEERLASEAGSNEAAEVHSQMAMLYKAQLKLLLRQSTHCDRDSA